MMSIHEIEQLATTNLSENGHSLLSPSGSGMWSRCAGSCIGLHDHRSDNKDNLASIEGTEGHLLLELSLIFMVSPHEIHTILPHITDEFKYEVFKWREGIISNAANAPEVTAFAKSAR